MQSLFSIAFFVFLALLAHLGIASTVYKKNLISGSLLSMLVLTSLICPLAYVNTVFIKLIIVTYLCIGFYFVFINRKIIFKIKKNEIKLFLIFLAFFLLYFRKLSPQFYIFYDHDLLYFSWIGQFLNPSVSGPIKLDISWPNQMASNHLLPGGIIAIASIFLKKQTLISSIAVRYLLISLYFSYFFSQWAYIKKINPYKFLGFLFLGMAIFGQEIGYEIKISSFIYVILILEILKNLFLTPNKQILLCLSLFLIIAKAPIFFVGLIFSLWIAYLNKEKISNLIWLIVTLVIINLTSWLLVAPPKVQGGLPFIINIFNREDILSLAGLKGWFITDAFSEIILKFFHGPFIIFALLIYILTKYYLSYFLITKQINESGDRTKIILLDAWVLPSILSWAFIRYPIGIGHTAHLYILMSVITLFFVLRFTLESKNYFVIIIFSLIAFMYGYPHRLIDPLYYMESELLKIPQSTMRISEIENGYLNDKDNEDYAVKNQIRAAMIGEKIDATKTHPTTKSVIYNWIIVK